jgi:hypothetical protein
MTLIWALRSRLEKQPTDLRRRHHYLRDGTLVSSRPFRHKSVVSESRRALLQLVVELKLNVDGDDIFRLALAPLSQDSICLSILSERQLLHFPRRRNPINCSLARRSNGLFAPLTVVERFRGAAAFIRWSVLPNASLLGSISQCSPRVREDARFSIHAPNILSCAPDCPAIATGNRN